MRLAHRADVRRLIGGARLGYDLLWWWPAKHTLHLRRLMIAAALAFVGYLAYALWRPQDTQCHAASCYIPVDFATSVLFAVLAYAAYFAVTHGWVLFLYQQQARHEPQRLLSGHHDIPELQQISLRSGLLLQLAERIRDHSGDDERPGPRDVPLILGEIGAGKSTFMVALAAHLAQRGVVPILVSLRNEHPPFDIRELARKCFLRHVDHRLLSATAADRLWRQVWHHRLVVVLVDGLDEALGRGQLIDARELADGLVDSSSTRLIASSRPESLVSRRGFAVLELEPLSRTELIGRLAGGHGTGPGLSEGDAAWLVETLGLPSTPFYLDVWNRLVEESASSSPDLPAVSDASRLKALAADICRVRGSDLKPSHDRARVQLLDRHLEQMTDRTEREFAIRREETDACVERLATVAYEHLGFKSINPEAFADGRASAGRAIVLGRRLGLLAENQTRDSEIRFRHPIFHAYLASMHLSKNRHDSYLVNRLLSKEASLGDEVFIALRLFGGRAETDAHTSATTIELLLDHAAESVRVSSALKSLAAAVRIASSASAGLSDDVLDRVLAVCGRQLQSVGGDAASSEDAGTAAARLRVMRALANLARSSDRSEQVYRQLWKCRDDPSYAARWQMVEAFALGGEKAFRAVGHNIRELMHTVELLLAKEPIDRQRLEMELLPQLSTIAKFLPSIVARLADTEPGLDACVELEKLIDLVNRLAAQRMGLGVEASLAQGFKFAAPRRGARVLDRLMFKEPHAQLNLTGRRRPLTGRPPAPFGSEGRVFWYSRVNLLQAAARRYLTLSADGENRALVGDLENHLRKARKHEAHPFVKAVADLCLQATERRGEADSLIWEDESVEVASAGTSLNTTAHSLLADIVIALNMNEQGRHEGQRAEDRSESFATASRLPACFEGTKRESILSPNGACTGHPTCGFALCGYRPELAQTAAYRPICGRFYDHQEQLAKRKERLHWQRGLDADTLASFWHRMSVREHQRDH